MTPLTPPLFIWDPNDLSVFDSAEAAERYLEAIDVNNGVYKAAYDARGRLLKLSTAGSAVRIEVAEEKPTHLAELETMLRTFVAATKSRSVEWLAKATPQQLMDAAVALAKTS